MLTNSQHGTDIRFFSLLLGGISKADEAKISVLTNTGWYVVAVLVLVILVSRVIRCSLVLGIKLQTNAYILTVGTACQVLVIGTYEFLKM